MLKKSLGIGIAVLGILAALALAGTIASADSIQCKSCNVAVNSNNGNLVVTYDVSGLGNTAFAQWVITASVSGHARCKNGGGNCPEAANKFGPTDLQTTGTFSVRNGRARGSISVAPATGLSCPNGQTATVLDVEWDNISFTVEGVTLINDAGPVNAALFTCP
jgi:hypothetical protein